MKDDYIPSHSISTEVYGGSVRSMALESLAGIVLGGYGLMTEGHL